jgi:hypothetical protein
VANHDFWCRVCGEVFFDVNVPMAIGATAGAPEHCGQRAAWMPAVGRMDASSGPGFQAFTARDGQNREVTVDSLRTLRRIERESEQQYRNGEGQPLVWRHYSNDPSNRDRHALHPRWQGGEAPDPAWVRKHGATLKRATAEADAASTAYGPGVSDATPSALDHLTQE